MSAPNRRRHANAIPIASFVTWALVGLFACAGGLGYVWCKNQLYTNGTEIKTLERDLAELQNKNEAARTKIATLSSMAKLQERLDTGFIKLVPITKDHVTVITTAPLPAKAGDLRPAANTKGSHE
jgi:hypothetical protein